MLARLQKFTTLGLLALALIWALLAWRAGQPEWAVGGALLIVFGYALVLGAEFMLLARVNRGDPAPPASAGQLWAAWWGEVRSAPLVFCWRQPFRSRVWPDHLPVAAKGRRGLLLVHGFVCNRGLWNRWYPRLQSLGVPFVAVNLEPVFGAIDDTAAIVEAAVQRLEQATGLAPVVVAHSMGGLALRCWWARPGNEARVHHAITLGTPHQGTWLARFAVSANGHQMQLNSAWLKSLAQREPATRTARVTCFYSHCDNIVFPASAATLAGADNRHLPGQAHVHMVDRPEPFDAVLSRLSPPPPG